MSLITKNKTTLKDTAIIFLEQGNGQITEETKGDLTIIKSDDKVIGLNVFNSSKYFESNEGVHTLNKDQVDAIEKLGYKIDNYDSKFSIGEVIEREVHPKSERLYLLKVKTDKELQIVTNAANAEVGKKVVVANIGAILPSGLPIVHSKVMGVESFGMLCGGETLGKEQTEGIMIVDGNNGDKFIL